MLKEQLVEEGIVSEIKNSVATVMLANKESCNECSAKLFCNPKGEDIRGLSAADPIGVNVGDRVIVSLGGEHLLTAALLLYGVPLVILIAGILTGYYLFEKNTELHSTFLGASLTGLYYLVIHSCSRKENRGKKFLPKIVSVEHVNPSTKQ
jgi:sigma-E factor negative regulatory protein RseC